MSPASPPVRPDAGLVAAAQQLLAAAQPAVDPLLVDIREALTGVAPAEACGVLEEELGRLLRIAPAELAPVLRDLAQRLEREAASDTARQHMLERLVAWATVLLTADRQRGTTAGAPLWGTALTLGVSGGAPAGG